MYLVTQVTKAVVTVPAKFTPAQKRATGEAYKRAGLKVHTCYMHGIAVSGALVVVFTSGFRVK